MNPVFVFIYLAVALRVLIAVKCNDFKKPKYRLSVPEETRNKRLLLMAYSLVFSVTVFWPIFFMIQPIEWIKGFIFGKKLAANRICFNFGKLMGRFAAWFSVSE